jgi:Leucine-rich repeat (LRR) protein
MIRITLLPLLFVFVLFNNLALSQESCLPGLIMLTSQADIDNFSANNPDCENLEGTLVIRDLDEQDITNLDGLSQIKSIGGSLQIRNTELLTNISGLTNLESVGGAIYLQDNDQLTSFDGLQNIRSAGEDLFIGQNINLESLEGLEGLISINGILTVRGNDKLTDIEGIRNIDPSTVESPTPGTDVFIRDNPLLSQCAIFSICGIIDQPGIATLFTNNMSGCNSRDEVVAACGETFPCDDASSQKDLASLISLYSSTNGDNWRRNDGWFEAINENGSCDYCDWYGIQCDLDGRVICIDMDGFPNCIEQNNLGVDMEGEIPASIGDLDKLEKLLLGKNKLYGTIPTEIGKLRNLKFFSVAYNDYSTEIPESIYNIENLEYLNLRDNEFNGSLSSSIGNLEKLTDIRMSRNLLTGNIPTEITTLKDLRYISVSNNLFTGSLPENLGDLSKVEVLYISDNMITGEIPSSIGDIDSLTLFSLGTNQLTGEIPNSLWSMPNVVFFSLRNNSLIGELPTDFSNMNNLRDLFLEGNQLSGEIPEELGALNTMRLLRMGDNNFSGELPSNLVLNITNLQLNDNDFTGCVSDQIIDSLCVWGTIGIGAYGDGINLTGNNKLAFYGNLDTLCTSANLSQIWAPCSTDENQNWGEYISEDCVCSIIAATEEIKSTDVIISPNPASDHVMIDGLDVSWNYSLKSIEGRKIKTGKLLSNKISTSDLEKGIYLLTFYRKNSNQYLTSKLVVSN